MRRAGPSLILSDLHFLFLGYGSEDLEIMPNGLAFISSVSLSYSLPEYFKLRTYIYQCPPLFKPCSSAAFCGLEAMLWHTYDCALSDERICRRGWVEQAARRDPGGSMAQPG